MRFDSWIFLLCFLPLMVAAYSLVTRKSVILSNLLILLGSFVFYGWNAPWVVVLLTASAATDFYLGWLIHRTEKPRTRTQYLVLSLVLNIGLLFVFRYATWLSKSLHDWFGFIPEVDLPVPPGISFYTFQSLSFIIDIYRRTLIPRATLVEYLAFVSFFPHLVAGPILKAREILPQLERVRAAISPRALALAIFMIAWGLFKKLACADNLGHLVEDAQKSLIVPGNGLVLALAFTFQIYADFSAYSDIARGTARLFGIRIPQNFLTPYISRNPSEFWQRWHISLSTWIREYLYISLGGNRGSQFATFRNLMITMFLAGLWHGAGKFFIAWGLYHGLLLVLYRFVPFDVIFKRLFGSTAGSVMAWALMFGFTVFGWVIFFSSGWDQFKAIIWSAAAWVGAPYSPAFLSLAWGLVLFSAPIIVSDVIGALHRCEFVDIFPAMSVVTKTALWIGLFYGVLFFAARSSYDFIYFQF